MTKTYMPQIFSKSTKIDHVILITYAMQHLLPPMKTVAKILMILTTLEITLQTKRRVMMMNVI